MSLTPDEALLLRDGDVVLIPCRVDRTNGHWDRNGVQVHVIAPFSRHHLPIPEREGPPPIHNLPSALIRSVERFTIKVGDYVEDKSGGLRGTVIFIDDDTKDVMIRVEKPPLLNYTVPDTVTRSLRSLMRIPTKGQLDRWKGVVR